GSTAVQQPILCVAECRSHKNGRLFLEIPGVRGSVCSRPLGALKSDHGPILVAAPERTMVSVPRRETMHIILAVASVGLIFVVLIDGFEAMVLPRRVTRPYRFARLFYRSSWTLWR